MKTILTEMPEWPEFIRGKDTLRIGYPWMALGAILAMERLVDPTWRVLELGSGGSTLFWARRCASVQSFETDQAWAQAVRLAVQEFPAVTVTLCATVQAIRDALETLPPASVDLLIVDHDDPESHRQHRTLNRVPLALAALPALKVGGWLLVDNYTCYGMRQFNWWQFTVCTFDEVGRVKGGKAYSGRGTRLGQRHAA